MVDILNIENEPVFDNRIVKIETHTYNPYANTMFGHSDEILISIQQQDLYTLPSRSYLYIEGKLTQLESENTTAKLTNNFGAFMFTDGSYRLNGVEIDRIRNVGMTSTLKNYTLLAPDANTILTNAGWDFAPTTVDGFFSLLMPLDMLFGFCEDYDRVVINARHELILTRARNDNNCLKSDPVVEPKIELLKIQWRMPHVMLNEVTKLSMLRTLESGRYLSMCFRSWDLYEYPLLQSTTKHSWAVKTATQLEKPRYVIFALQTGRKNVMSEDVTIFDHCKLTNVKLYLNSEFYPYDDMNLDFDKQKFSNLYEMFSRIRNAYYGCVCREAALSKFNFLTRGPFVVIDCSRQNESVKSATVDVRLEFDCKENIPANTTAYCLIIHDRVVQYNPLTNVVRKIT